MKKFWGQGIATETGKRVLQHAFEHGGLNTVSATVHPGNAGSIGVLRKLGFRKIRDAAGEEWMDTWEVRLADFIGS
jgi:RimJ/RimL family protein N-acetyltransferase